MITYHNEAHDFASNIPIFLNAEFVCSVEKYQLPQRCRGNFWTGRGQKILNNKVSFCPKIAKHLQKPKMFNRSRVFAHTLFIESKRGMGRASSVWRLLGYTTKIIHF